MQSISGTAMQMGG